MGDQTPAEGGGTRSLRWATGAVLLGTLLIYNSVDHSDASPPAATSGAHASPSAAAAPEQLSGPVLPRSRPVRLSIPRLGVDAPFTDLRLNTSGVLEPPPADAPNLVGWYRGGAAPGEVGTAVVAGHVDTTTGPAVFLLLRILDRGDTVDVTRADGITATFTVDSVETYRKDDFPSERVYDDSKDAQLRLITCGGPYDPKHGGYTANVVVFAHLESFRQS
jgi:hypothetical protein